MMQGVIEILLDDVPYRNLVGLTADGTKYKVFPVVCPQTEKYNYTIATKTATSPIDCKGSISGYDQVNFTLLHYGLNYIDADSLHELSRSALDMRSSITENGIYFDEIRFVTDQDLFDNEAQLYVRKADYTAIVKREIS